MGTEGRGDFVCSRCHAAETCVTDSRGNRRQTTIRRRRECLRCSFRFTTYETSEHPKETRDKIEKVRKALTVLREIGDI